MTTVFVILAVAAVLFASGRVRLDVVALLTVLALPPLGCSSAARAPEGAAVHVLHLVQTGDGSGEIRLDGSPFGALRRDGERLELAGKGPVADYAVFS